MNNRLLRKTIFPFILTAVVFFFVNLMLVELDVLTKYNLKDWYWNYIFLIPVSVLGLTFITIRYCRTQKITTIGKSYFLYTSLKMFVAVLFLLPWLLNPDDTSKPMVIQFFAVFFPFLLVETILLVRLLNTPLGEKNKIDQNQGE